MKKSMTLHEGMRKVLRSCPDETATLTFLSAEIARRDLYVRKDGLPAPPTEISARANVYSVMFERVGGGKIRLRSSSDAAGEARDTQVTRPVTASTGRGASDEGYVISLSDAILGLVASRQHRFDFLRGDTGYLLPVDAYYPMLGLVVEYRERQHTESVPFFDKRITASGVDRQTQRRMYDQRRRDVLPEHGMTLVEVDYHLLVCKANKRLARDRQADMRVLQALLAAWSRQAKH